MDYEKNSQNYEFLFNCGYIYAAEEVIERIRIDKNSSRVFFDTLLLLGLEK